MPISDEVRQIIAILEEEGFGALAGELLTEISLGRPVEIPVPLLQLAAEEDDADADADADAIIERVPIEEGEQLSEALQFLRFYLVQPVRLFAEAERVAGELIGNAAVRIRYIDPVERIEIAPISNLDLGDASVADKLDEFIGRLPTMIVLTSLKGG